MNTNTSNEFKTLLVRSPFATPTVLLFVASLMLTVTSTALGLSGDIPLALAVGLNAIAVYWFFTVMHDASHSAISTTPWVNSLFGYLSVISFSPILAYRAFRFIHMQHHRFTNEDRMIDPDHWCGGGSKWTLPFRWATLDAYYYYFYLNIWRSRPASEVRTVFVSSVLGLSILFFGLAQGYGEIIFWYWFVPARIAVFFLGLAFDFLPHMPYKATQAEDKYQATSNRIGMEWLLTPLLCYQNYHLVHHLYPLVPFYRYIKIWRANQAYFMAQNPLLVDPLGHEIVGQANSNSNA